MIGAGPAGLTAALRLHRAGADVSVFEASSTIGGLSRSISLWGQQLELSAHIFWSTDPFVSALWREFVDDPIEHDLRRAISIGDRTISYPMTPVAIARALSPTSLMQVVAGFGAARLRGLRAMNPDGADNAETWMVEAYGRPLYELLFRDYAEKLWGLPCHRIDADFPRFLFDSADATDGVEQRFVRPRHGLAAAWDNMAHHLQSEGVEVYLNEPVERITIQADRVAGITTSHRELPVDGLISTMPLGRLATMAFPTNADVGAVASQLRTRSTVLVYLLATGSRCPFNWLALYSSDLRFGRVTDFGSWVEMNGTSTIYCLEAWCDTNDDLWQSADSELVDLATAELAKSGQFGDVSVADHHVERVASTHPSFGLGSVVASRELARRIDEIAGLATVGRGGGHSLYGMAESMAAAKTAADQVLATGKNKAG